MLPEVDLLEDDHSSVYIVLCTCCHLVYIGKTIRPPWVRFKEELMTARRASHFPLNATWRRRLSHTDHLLLHGLDKAIILVIESYPGLHDQFIKQREMAVMRMFPRDRLLNDKVPHNSRITMHISTMTICRQGIKHILSAETFRPLLQAMERYGIRELANKILTSQRVIYDARTLLLLYQHLTGYFTQNMGLMIHFKRCMLRRLKVMHTRLPMNLVLRVIQLTGHEQQAIMAILKKYIDQLPLHPLLKFYYKSVIVVVRTQASPIGVLLYNYKRVLNTCTGPLLQHACEITPEKCQCRLYDLPRINGHICFRPLDLNTTTSSNILTNNMIIALQQPMKGVPQLPARQRWRILKQDLKKWRQPIMKGNNVDGNFLYTNLYTIINSKAVDPQGYTIMQQAKSAMRRLNGCCCGPLDKAPNAIWISCNTFYLQQLYHKFLGPTGIGGFKILPNIATAASNLYNNIHQHQHRFYASSGALQQLKIRTAINVPSFYMLYKNKMFPTSDDTIKLRPITSHYRHPFKPWASKCTRGLSVMLKLASKSLGSTVSLHCGNILDSVAYWKQGIDNLSSFDSVSLFEYDIADMYYHIPKEECRQLLTQFFELFRSTFKRRSVAINKGSRQLDRIGCGSSELYHTIPLHELFNYCLFELIDNVYAHVGLVCFEQTMGIPMGALPSGILANIYLFMRELNGQAVHLTRNFFVFRYMDNIPGIFDTTKTSLEEIHSILSHIYNMPLKLEQTGPVLDSLEIRLILQPQGILFYHKPLLTECFLKYLPQYQVNSNICRIPPTWCANFKRFLILYVNSVLLKCVRFSSSFLGMVIGVVNLLKGLQSKGFSLTQLVYLFKQFSLRHFVPSSIFSFVNSLLSGSSDLFPS